MRKALLQRVVTEAAAGSDSPVARCAYTPAKSTPDTCPADGQPRQGGIAIDTPLDFVGDERSADATADSAARVRDVEGEHRLRRDNFQNQSEQKSSPTASAADGWQADSSAGQPVSVEQPAAAEHTDGPKYDQLRRVHSSRPGSRAARRGRQLLCVGQKPPQVLRRAEWCALDAQTLHLSLSPCLCSLCLRLPRLPGSGVERADGAAGAVGHRPSFTGAGVPSPASNSPLELRLYDCCCLRARRLLRPKPPPLTAAPTTAATPSTPISLPTPSPAPLPPSSADTVGAAGAVARAAVGVLYPPMRDGRVRARCTWLGGGCSSARGLRGRSHGTSGHAVAGGSARPRL